MVSRKYHACHALRHGSHRRRARGPPTAHPLWCRESATPAVPWTTVVLCCAVLCCAELSCAE
eukprot:5829620-Pyramimonas_sp.AAC.1